jgi:hypothetical protein
MFCAKILDGRLRKTLQKPRHSREGGNPTNSVKLKLDFRLRGNDGRAVSNSNWPSDAGIHATYATLITCDAHFEGLPQVTYFKK